MSEKEIGSLQRKIILNRVRRGWPSANDLSKTSLGLLEEAGEFEKARRKEDVEEMIDALGDVMVFCLGAFEILCVNGLIVTQKIVEANVEREHTGEH